MRATVYLALGARDGHPRRQLLEGIAYLRESGILIRRASGLWETEPVGIGGEAPVLNAALEAETALAPHDLMAACRSAEDRTGRRRGTPAWRSLDVDILLMGDLVMDDAELTIPHPRFHRRRFNLEPLCEIAPGHLHPILGATIADLLRACDDAAWARRLEPPSWLTDPGAPVASPRDRS
ncbi:MAG: 2-amino-4-hydroxy-6-hydroxymethyldihydropteridine diphosphokinase [Acidobacteria bacterium]|nr:2-amino-4-hydroxy-6-hydroxymethyldihydropteridine diphosphokinase [Acidobacteriota bacterium]